MHDRARIHVEAGAGGAGCLSFRREAHVPKGGPDGGDGGRGGDVFLVCDDSLRDLQSFRRRIHFKAGMGGHGEGALRHGGRGQPLEIPVPPGTQAVVERDGSRYDLLRAGQRALIARGGSGGRGNKRFAGPTNQTPRFAERGLPGEESWITLQLKLLADVGLVGLPNAGKSSLLSRLTRAHPRVADYPFTTLEPVLGTLEGEERQLVIADIPGLIEGAGAGAGLGHEFLAHVERTRVLVHVLDSRPLDGSDPVENHATVERELAAYDARLATLPRVLALSKVDLVEPATAERARSAWSERLGRDVPVMLTSAVTGAGLDRLAAVLLHRVEADRDGDGEGIEADRDRDGKGVEADRDRDGEGVEADRKRDLDKLGQAAIEAAELAQHRVFRPAGQRAYRVDRVGDRSFRVSGERVERLLARYDLDNEEALAHLERRLRGIGVIDALTAAGFEAGDDVEIAGVAFDLDPDL
jgi:GTP-binding protein